ncbi:hypothetical protein L596_012594 [Steinernema carpocapsae]|uniref:Uncharacterized protein n=1 Tax=Steinernema carpocapsae TaxID=34508 RepID=A0A4U5NXJ9_STECR|nr:hypothetical protein L596_012594 [Steinernema carpocapsae]
MPQSFPVLCTPAIGGYAASSHHRRLRRFTAPQKRLAPRAFGSRSYYHKTKVALRPSSVASPPRFCQHLTALRCFAQLRSAAPPPLPTFGGFAASQLRKRGSALRAFGSRSYYHKTKVALRPSSVASPPRFCQHLTALRCFAQLRSAAPPPLPTFGGFAASQLRKRGSALRAFGSRSYYHKTKVALRPSSVASPPRFCQHLTALRCFAQLRSAAPPPLPTFGGFAASQLRKRGSALRAFGSRSYYHKTKVAPRPSVASPPRVNAGGNDPGAPG